MPILEPPWRRAPGPGRDHLHVRIDSAVGGDGLRVGDDRDVRPALERPGDLAGGDSSGQGDRLRQIGTADVDATRVIVQAPTATDDAPGTAIGLALPPEHTYFFDAETGEAQLHRERLTL